MAAELSGVLTAGERVQAQGARLTLALGAAVLWGAWALMPDAATNDAAHIAQAVGSARERVWWSAALQLASCALFVPGVLSAVTGASGRTRVGAGLLLVGLMGMAADAVYHQAAYQLTAPDVDVHAALPVLTRMQTEDIRTLVPLLLAFPVGAALFSLGLAGEGRAPCWTGWAVWVGLGLLVPGVPAVRLLGLSRQWLFLAFLAALCAALAGGALQRREPPVGG